VNLKATNLMTRSRDEVERKIRRLATKMKLKATMLIITSRDGCENVKGPTFF
jgi:hypothetical protein